MEYSEDKEEKDYYIELWFQEDTYMSEVIWYLYIDVGCDRLHGRNFLLSALPPWFATKNYAHHSFNFPVSQIIMISWDIVYDFKACIPYCKIQ